MQNSEERTRRMNQQRRRGLIFVLIGLALFIWTIQAQSQNGVVVRVVDGDTLKVWIADKIQTLRLIGVDTPETVHPTKDVQEGGPEASAFTQAVLDRQTIRLESDPAGAAVDRYGRLLRYVYLADGKNFNAILIREGYATATRRFPYALKCEFLALEAQARKARRGIWATAGRSSQ